MQDSFSEDVDGHVGIEELEASIFDKYSSIKYSSILNLSITLKLLILGNLCNRPIRNFCMHGV